MTFQPAKQQQVDTSYSEDTSSQFSHMNESLDEKRT
jgi:chromosome segregation ATPase